MAVLPGLIWLAEVMELRTLRESERNVSLAAMLAFKLIVLLPNPYVSIVEFKRPIYTHLSTAVKIFS